MKRLLSALFLSGAASLVYQVSFTRALADVTSATAYAQAIVLAIFFTGLGLGAVYPGRRAATARRPIAGYAAIEVGVGVAALLTLLAFPACERARAGMSHAGASPVLALAVAVAVAGAALLVPATLMGASLPFVLEEAERVLGPVAARRFVGLAYGVNTLGAAVGCALSGFVLVERVGLARTTATGAALSLAAAGIAATRARRARRRDVDVDASDRAHGVATTDARIPLGMLGAAALAGLVGVGAEVVWTRLISLLVLNTVYAFSQVLVAVLVGIALGAWLSRWLAARAGVGAILRVAAFAQIGAALAVAAVPPCCLLLAGHPELEAAFAAGRSPLGALVLMSVLVAPVALNATTLPLLVSATGGARTSRSFGALYAANTAGSVVGSLLAGFALIPWLGTTRATALLAAVGLLLAFLLLWMGSDDKADAAAALIPGVVVVAVQLLFPDVTRQIYAARIPRGTHIVDYREGVASDVMVTDADGGQRRLWINSSWVAGTGGGHRALGHLPALFVETPRRAVGIALGTGQTFAAVFAHGVTDLDVVEIDPEVIRASRRWFGDANGHLFEHPGVHVHEDDGRAFLRATRDRFDLVVLEPLQAWSAGTSSLYAREFYEEARRVLAPGGVVAQWIPFYGQGVEETRAMVRTAADVFPNASLWLDEHDGILILQAEPIALSPAQIAARIAARHLEADLATKSIRGPVDVLSLLVLGPEGIARWTRGAKIITDDRPFLEFAAARQVGEDSFAALVRSLDAARDGARPEALSVTGGPSPDALEADAASRALAADASDASVVDRAACEPRPSPACLERYATRATALERAIAEAPSSNVLRSRYRALMDAWAWALSSTHAPGDVLEKLLRRAVAHDDDDGEAMLNLAVLAAERHDPAARTWAERATRCDRVKVHAEAFLARLPP